MENVKVLQVCNKWQQHSPPWPLTLRWAIRQKTSNGQQYVVRPRYQIYNRAISTICSSSELGVQTVVKKYSNDMQ
eukprot:scaffold277343_cov19-Tisochrysis_lutea.AAC.1